jgi:hypothetical protein
MGMTWPNDTGRRLPAREMDFPECVAYAIIAVAFRAQEFRA